MSARTDAFERVTLHDRMSGGRVWLTVRDGVVTGAMGCEPARYVGQPIERARRIARHDGAR